MEPLDSGTSTLSMAATSFFAQGLYVLWSTVQHGGLPFAERRDHDRCLDASRCGKRTNAASGMF
jgi:hypothetical protein